MRKVLSTITAALVAAVFAGGLSWGFGLPYYSSPFQAGNLLSHFNNLIQEMNSYIGMVSAQPGPIASTATTAEQTFATTTLPGGTLSLPGQTLVIRCNGTTGADTQTKTAHLYFGGYEYSTASMSTSAESWELELTVTAVSAAANSVIAGRGSSATATVAPTVTQDQTDNLANAVTVKCTGTQGTASAADMTMYNFVVWQEK